MTNLNSQKKGNASNRSTLHPPPFFFTEGVRNRVSKFGEVLGSPSQSSVRNALFYSVFWGLSAGLLCTKFVNFKASNRTLGTPVIGPQNLLKFQKFCGQVAGVPMVRILALTWWLLAIFCLGLRVVYVFFRRWELFSPENVVRLLASFWG